MADTGDDRDVELGSLSAIFPEIQHPHPDDPYTILLDLPVTPSQAVTVFFPGPVDSAPPQGNDGPPAAGPGQRAAVDSHQLAHLPPLRLEIAFGSKYPAEQPPKASVSTSPPWLPAATIKQLEDDAARLWEDMGRDMVGFAYIDHVQQAAERVFDLVDVNGSLEVDPSYKIAILDYDIQARKAAFDKETYECGVCLEPKKGSACHKMLDCGHVFCVACLQDFYEAAIKEGNVAAVRCPAPSCAREREKAAGSSGKKRKKPRTYINPSELLQIPIDPETVKRYVDIKYKLELEADKNTIYCPRSWCGGAARSKKRKKPEGLELAEVEEESGSEDDDIDDGDQAEAEGKSKPYKAPDSLLAICEDCDFAFCSRCRQSWHGEYVLCAPPAEKGQPSAEENATLEYLRYYTTPCPTCSVPAQKTMGCNHMICARCQTHFCYLCAAWLSEDNPYSHFNEDSKGNKTSCYGRLWELELGDGDDVGHNFAGGPVHAPHPAPAPAPAPAPVPAQRVIPEIEEPDDDDDDNEDHNRNGRGRDNHGARDVRAAAGPALEAHADGGQVGIAREGPLVLRIAANRPAAPARGGAARRGGGRGAAAAVGAQQQQGRNQRGGAARGAAAQRGWRGRGANNNNNNNNNNPAGRGPRRREVPDVGGDFVLAPADQEWVRQFVQLALNDQEDILLMMEDDEGADI
ncbi:hypothetical protein VTJ83DRAFT_5753 [Remersonia thermophila]|uniref:RBR-type E3 ubiquitin transferase n=1 Tax=Remersonia thermophila TaxID=72144 RepID=A0ABR4D7V5_9PEZI